MEHEFKKKIKPKPSHINIFYKLKEIRIVYHVLIGINHKPKEARHLRSLYIQQNINIILKDVLYYINDFSTTENCSHYCKSKG